MANNNYASFYDDTRQIWSVLFSVSSDIQQFAKQVRQNSICFNKRIINLYCFLFQIAIAKCNSEAEPLRSILIQDLVPIPPAAEALQSFDVVYTCSLLVNDKTTSFKDSTNYTVQSFDENGAPWIKGLIGCGGKSKRVIIIPYSLSVSYYLI